MDINALIKNILENDPDGKLLFHILDANYDDMKIVLSKFKEIRKGIKNNGYSNREIY